MGLPQLTARKEGSWLTLEASTRTRVLTPDGRRRMVECVLDRALDDRGDRRAVPGRREDGAQVARPVPRRRRGRSVGSSSRPHRSPNRTPRSVSSPGVAAAPQASLGCGPHRVSRSASRPRRCSRSCAPTDCGRLDRGDRRPTEPVRRYQRDRPGELIHVDVKKLAAIPDGGGWRIHGRGNDGHGGHSGVGYRYLHTAIDDRTRIAYSEILNDEQAVTAAAFWRRAAAWFAARGITSNVSSPTTAPATGPALAPRLPRHRHHVKKHPAPPAPDQRQGRTLPPHPARGMGLHPPLDLRTQRAPPTTCFIHFYNHHRSHGALGWLTPMPPSPATGTTSPRRTTSRWPRKRRSGIHRDRSVPPR